MSETHTLNLPIGGMTCAACTAHVEEALRRVDGVTDVTADLITRTAAVHTSYALQRPATRTALAEKLVTAVEAAGYTAHVPSDDDDILDEQRRADAELAREAHAHLIRGVVGIAAGAVCMALMLTHALSHMALLAIFIPLSVVIAWPIFVRAVAAARHKTTDMHTLIALGVLASIASSLMGEHAIDGALFITGFVLFGQALEARARGKASAALTALTALEPDTAHLKDQDSGDITDVSPKALRIGDVVVVRAGERVPGDGVVSEGLSEVNEAHLTGEARAVRKTVGDVVRAASVNTTQPLTVRLTHLGKDSTLHQLLRLLREAQARRPKAARLADRVSSIFVPTMLVLAAAVFIFWTIYADAATAARYATAVLVVACPCAMGLAVPTATVTATGRAAQLGVLVKGGDVLERLADVERVIFDKTGTLTLGPELTSVITLGDATESSVLALATALERDSEHPLARLVREAAKARGVRAARVTGVTAVAGQGLVGMRGDVVVGIGNERMCDALGVVLTDDDRAALEALDEPLFVVDDGRVVGALGLREVSREGTAQAVAALRAHNIGVEVLTGDRRARAVKTAAMVGIAADDVVAEVWPQDKLTHIEQSKVPVMFVGDGVNDAAALAASHVGVALGDGTAVAGAAASVVLMSGTLETLPKLIALSRRTRRVIAQNLGWALAYNAVMLPLAAGALSSQGLLLPPTLASVVMASSSITVVMNSLRLRR